MTLPKNVCEAITLAMTRPYDRDPAVRSALEAAIVAYAEEARREAERLRRALRSVLDSHADCDDGSGTICPACAIAMAELSALTSPSPVEGDGARACVCGPCSAFGRGPGDLWRAAQDGRGRIILTCAGCGARPLAPLISEPAPSEPSPVEGDAARCATCGGTGLVESRTFVPEAPGWAPESKPCPACSAVEGDGARGNVHKENDR